MNIKDALAWGTKQLKRIDTPALDASVLLCETIKKPKEFLYTYPEKKLTVAQRKKYKKFIRRRAKHEPVAYILGKKEFYGFEFLVNKNVLIPRPDTETLISTVLSTIGSETPYSYPHLFALELSRATRCKQVIIDIGTGSGTIAVTLKKLLPKTQVFASDISPTALALAKKNARRLLVPRSLGEVGGAKIIFKKGNLLIPLFSHPTSILPSEEREEGGKYPSPLSLEGEMPEGQRGCRNLIITANLPYLSRAEWLKTAPEVKKYEPYGALVGGKKGTEIYEKLFKELLLLLCHSREGGNLIANKKDSRLRGNDTRESRNDMSLYLFIEIGHNQKPAIIKLAKKILRPQTIEFIKDLSGKWRVAKITLT